MQQLRRMATSQPAALKPEASKLLAGVDRDFQKVFSDIATRRPELARQIRSQANGVSERLGGLVKIEHRQALITGKAGVLDAYAEARKTVDEDPKIQPDDKSLYKSLLDRMEKLPQNQRELALQALDKQVAATSPAGCAR